MQDELKDIVKIAELPAQVDIKTSMRALRVHANAAMRRQAHNSEVALRKLFMDRTFTMLGLQRYI